MAWIARTGPSPAGDGRRGNFEATPLKVGESLYVCTGDNVVLALDAATGRTRWKFDPRIEARRLPPFRSCRGVAYARTSDVAGLCAERIFTGTLDAALWALDSASGKPCPDFGVGGRVDLLRGMSPAEPGYYYVTSAPTVVRGRVVVGGWVSDNQYVGEPSGVVRAFDARSGQLAWAWDVDHLERHGPPASRPGSGTTASPSRCGRTSLVFVPTGNATPISWACTARRAATLRIVGGRDRCRDRDLAMVLPDRHHDVWDYDVA